MNNISILLLISIIIELSQSTTGTTSTVSFFDTNIYTRSQSQNTLYAVGTSNYNVYRLNYTRLNFPSTVQFKLSHTDTVRTMSASSGERYLATGSKDYHIQVWQIYPKRMACKFFAYNQLRKVIFHPSYEEILFAASVDDMIRKYNISNCSKLTEISVGWSIHSMAVSDDGNYLFYGTLQGHVGYMDTNLSNNIIKLNQHRMTVLFIFNTYPGFYVSIGDDSKIILWNNGNIITSMTSISARKLIFCDLFGKAELIDQHRIIGCSDRMEFYSMTKITNTSILRASTHQCGISYSSIKWMDFRWIIPDEGQWVIHTGTTLMIHKIYYTSTTRCNPQLTAEPILKICRHCGYLLPGCYQCVAGPTCTLCSPITYLSGGQCINCPVECALCISATSCSICAVGFEQNGNSGKCVTETKYQAGCYQYGQNGNTCQVPGNGYYVNGGVCRPCNQTKTACLECTESTTPQCLTCKTGYFVSGTGCTLCSSTMATMSGCLACSNSTVCLKCTIAFRYYGSNIQCSACHPTCQTCLTFYDQCSLCYPTTQFRYLKDDKCLCMDGYYDIQNTNVYVCPLCSSVLSFCYLCTNNTICIQCQAMYYKFNNGSKVQCQLCDKYCQSCQGTSSNCTSCNSVNYNRVLSGSSCVCDTGYTMVNMSIPCTLCGKLMDGCLACSSYSYCTSCDTGYILVQYSVTNRTCLLCPYYCPDCGVDFSGKVICLSCPANSFRTLVNGNCTCDTGYFDDNNTVVCELCSAVLTNCLTCTTRRKCLSCAPGMFTDASQSLCAPCQPTCLSCSLYFDTCSTCDPGSNRVLSGNKCVCKSDAYEDDGVCLLCEDAIRNCNSCTNQYICTGCKSGFTLQQDLSGCIDCKAQINGCQTCTSKTNCTTCLVPFTLIQKKCRCPNTMYTSKQDWGSCVEYGIPGLQSGLGVQIQPHQHQNNRIIVFIRFRAKNLYVLNKTLTQSISMSINGVGQEINFDEISNNKVKISTQLKQSLYSPEITITFQQEVFYNEYLLTLPKKNYTTKPRRLYVYNSDQIKTYESTREALKYIFYILKWIFFAFSIIGQVHLLFPFVVIIQLLPIFLMLNMSLPANLSMVLDAMMTFQVKSIIPMFSIKSKSLVIFPPMTYDYYGLYDFFLLGKIGDMLLIVLVNVMTKFDEGIVRMFPPGRIRRYLYQSLVRKGYAAMSLSILSFQPSIILLTGVYLTFVQWQNSQQIFNYCCCLFGYGFYLGYNFNHASNLQGSKLMKNIQNQNCFLDINSQQPAAPRTTLFVLVSDFWMIGSFHLVGPMVYFVTTIVMLAIRIVVHVRRNFYIGRVQFAVRTSANIFLLAVFCIMFVFYLAENQITLTFDKASIMGLMATVFIFLYMLCYIIQKVLYNFKLETDFVRTKIVQNANGQQVLVAKVEDAQNGQQPQVKNQQNQSSRSHKMQQFFDNTVPKQAGGFSALNFRNKNNPSQRNQSQHNATNKQDSNQPLQNNSGYNTKNNSSFHNNSTHNAYNPTNYNSYNPYNNNSLHIPRQQYHPHNKGNTQKIATVNADSYFNNNTNPNSTSRQKEKELRIKSANTSRYARNHLELRYKAQNILTKKPDQFQE